MSLLDRLIGIEEPTISVHSFWAGMVELSLGEITAAQLKTYFDLAGQDATDLDWLIGKYQASANKERFLELMHVIFLLAGMDTPGYTTNAEIVARINRIG